MATDTNESLFTADININMAASKQSHRTYIFTQAHSVQQSWYEG